ncbi:hypothetical protein D3C72_2522600 [compost metagenome]
MAFTRIPCGPSSIANDLVKPITAHLDAEYTERPAKPRWPAADDRLIITPALDSFSRGMAWRAHRN